MDSNLLNEFVTANDLLDINLTNSNFTWFGPENKKSRIDRAFVNNVGYKKRRLEPISFEAEKLISSTNNAKIL